MGRRRARRRNERARSKRPTRPKRSPIVRLGLVVLGLLMAAGGLALLITGSAGTSRLFRVEGILIILGVALVLAGVMGW